MHIGTETSPDLHGEVGLTSVGGACPLVCRVPTGMPPPQELYSCLLENARRAKPPRTNVMHAGDFTFPSGHIKKVKMKLTFTNYFDLYQPTQYVLLMCNQYEN